MDNIKDPLSLGDLWLTQTIVNIAVLYHRIANIVCNDNMVKDKDADTLEQPLKLDSRADVFR